MRSLREFFFKKQPPVTQPISPEDRRRDIMALPIDPNGRVFHNSLEAETYKKRLTTEGYRVVEGTTPDGIPFLRPQSLAEFDAIQSCFDPNGISKEELIKVLDEYSQKALDGGLGDVPLYRKPPRDKQQS